MFVTRPNAAPVWRSGRARAGCAPRTPTAGSSGTAGAVWLEGHRGVLRRIPSLLRFYQGRRTSDDERQIGRWAKCAGVTGRWRNNLISKIARAGCGWDNLAISPVVRQTLHHWGYTLTQEDFNKSADKFRK